MLATDKKQGIEIEQARAQHQAAQEAAEEARQRFRQLGSTIHTLNRRLQQLEQEIRAGGEELIAEVVAGFSGEVVNFNAAQGADLERLVGERRLLTALHVSLVFRLRQAGLLLAVAEGESELAQAQVLKSDAQQAEDEFVGKVRAAGLNASLAVHDAEFLRMQHAASAAWLQADRKVTVAQEQLEQFQTDHARDLVLKLT